MLLLFSPLSFSFSLIVSDSLSLVDSLISYFTLIVVCARVANAFALRRNTLNNSLN